MYLVCCIHDGSAFIHDGDDGSIVIRGIHVESEEGNPIHSAAEFFRIPSSAALQILVWAA